MTSDGFNIDDYVDTVSKRSRYEKRVTELQNVGFEIDSVVRAVDDAMANVRNGVSSFVIYGEPQSGKTEMMIALTARLLDEGHRIILVLMNDSVQLLEQNLDRFLRAGLDPAPKKFNEILDPSIAIGTSTWVIFCKKNSADLQKLLSKLKKHPAKVVIDDEADYATPNAKVNRQEKTRINGLIEQLLGSDGIYIGVTATPARLDLNNTFDNDSERWVNFPAHSQYTGQEVFFPTSREGLEALKYKLVQLPDQGDDPRYLRHAVLSFMVNVAYLNSKVNAEDCNYSMLIHTSGKKVDHTKDFQQVVTLLGILRDSDDPKYSRYLEEVFDIAKDRHPGLEKDLTSYIVEHASLSDVVVMNSNTERNAAQYKRATSPATMFTIAIGGNIVSRGVTFDNLLTMFFTRDVKHKIQQDTYIQRARMFGSRGGYLQYFELHIPTPLYFDWQKCFVFHRLALSVIREGKGSPVWLEDKRIAATASPSIDLAAVGIDSGEMSWEMFDISDAINAIVDDETGSVMERIRSLASAVGESALPRHLLSFIEGLSLGSDSIALHSTATLGEGYGTPEERAKIRRRRGYIGTNQLERARYPHAIHHIKIFANQEGRARVFYKYTPETGSIRFLKNYRGGKLT
ncbi:Z1 domain-containing protein [Ferrimicrobium sp.]|uniref:Z1 domain-containing protein n=1 Tax=Ferrimicrobium sp. TaxID=2926050 RepID=UPI002633E7A3|nr:Z1 domain-containing protein [Ferrimicrobium sp.]